MTGSRGGFQAALAIGWMALCVAGILYARFKGIPFWAAAPALAAFLTAYPFYLLPGFPALRERLGGARFVPALVALAVLPYLAACSGAISFRWTALGQLIALAVALGLWFFALPEHPATDLGFLALVAWMMLGKYFAGIYPTPYPGLELSILGKVAVFEIAILSLMLARRVPETGYGFIPSRRDWLIGGKHFLYFVVLGLPLALWIGAIKFAPPKPVWLIAATFLGFLWVVALAEEFFFRGVLQQWMENWLSSRAAALFLTSLLFGLVHLPFRGFPNWKWVLVAGILGWFCGRARNESGGIRAAVVTHALVVTVWRGFFATP